jgi:cysteine desulfurase
VDFGSSGLTSMAVSAHKVGGPVGVGALIARRDASLTPLALGGGQQRGRSGTLDAPGAAAFAAAIDKAVEERDAEAARVGALRNRLLAGVTSVRDAVVAGPTEAVSPHILNVVFPGARAEAILFALDQVGLEVSSGSACTAGVVDASHVLLAMGYSVADAAAAIRISLGYTSNNGDIDALLAALPTAVAQARAAFH